jgi:peroxiredoxin
MHYRIASFWISVVAVLAFNSSAAQTEGGFKYEFKINGVKDTVIYLANYYGNQLYFADTARIDSNSRVVFEGETPHPGGIYAVVAPGQKYFEIILAENELMIETDVNNFIGKMNIVKSKENSIFYDYIRYLGTQKQLKDKATQKANSAKTLKKDKEEKKYRAEAIEIDKKVLEYQRNLVKDNSDLLVSKIVNMSLEPVVPPNPNPADSSFSYRYYRAHYFDNFDLTEDRLVRSPIFHQKLEYYFKNVIPQVPDTIIREADALLAKVINTDDLFKYIAHHITYTYETSKIMGMDKVFVHQALSYYCPDPKGNIRADWLTKKKQQKVCERARKLNPLLIGKKAPYIALTDSTEKKWLNFYSIKSDYTILVFWDPNCSHCKTDIPALHKMWKEELKAKGVEVFAVAKATGDDFEAWKKFIREHNLDWTNVGLTKNIFNQASKDNGRSVVPKYTTAHSLNYSNTYDVFSTPQVYILDKNKMIKAKKIDNEQIPTLIDMYIEEEKMEKGKLEKGPDNQD